MTDLFLIVIIVAAVTVVTVFIVIILLIWLVRTQLKLKHDYRLLANVVHGNNNDIAGLCSAALTVNSRITTTEDQIKILWAKSADHKKNEQYDHPYSGVLQKIRSGASVHELMQNSGLSHDEAALLIRLHGSEAKP
jgi:type II secretory pathway component PulF